MKLLSMFDYPENRCCTHCGGMGFEDYPHNSIPCRIQEHYQEWGFPQQNHTHTSSGSSSAGVFEKTATNIYTPDV